MTGRDEVRTCLCGLNLWQTKATAPAAAWARHVDHMRAFEAETQRIVAAAAAGLFPLGTRRADALRILVTRRAA